ncbi:MAG TPA: hypothetical protein VGS97_19975 [Actinocrinis sp.]|uniref:hypothetical protein n=1 Tax=Actinocrinis sp. TaxID=1920516 RepID=UPI002DDD9756|nr:hypothetical protein [Actinocrinis sp.]HEV2346387.1 hypothetical protein [Actinocrinis sp.]
MMMKLTPADLDRITELVHLQADILTEEGNLQAAGPAAELAVRLDQAREARQRRGTEVPVLLV